MSSNAFQFLVILIAFAFVAFFCASVVPALIDEFDIIGAFAAGFVNPYSSGYSVDVIACWLILLVWVIYERQKLDIQYGWVCVAVGIVPGVAVGFAAYLVLRLKQLSGEEHTNA